MTDATPEQNYNLSDSIGSTGLKHSGGFVYEEFLERLQGQRGVKVYREMVDNSSVIGAARFLFRLLMRQVDWRFEPEDDSPEAKKQAEFTEGVFGDMDHTFEEMLDEIMTALDYGWAFMEMVFKLRKGRVKDPTIHSAFDDGLWGLRKIQLRGQETLFNWEIDRTGEILGMHQFDEYAGHNAFIPMAKAVLFRTETVKNNPEGRSIWRNAVTDYHSLKRVAQMELVGVERDMTGLLTMEVPIEMLQAAAGTDLAATRTALGKMLSELKRDAREYAMVPAEKDSKGNSTGYVLKLLTTGGSRQHDTTAIKTFLKVGMLQTVLAQFIQLGMDKAGSWSLVSSATNTFGMAVGGIMDGVIAAPINKYVIPKLCALNGFDPEFNPHIVHGDIETPNRKEIAEYITALAGAGFDLSDPAIQRKLLEIGDLPMPEEDAPLVPSEAEEVEEEDETPETEPETPATEEE